MFDHTFEHPVLAPAGAIVVIILNSYQTVLLNLRLSGQQPTELALKFNLGHHSLALAHLKAQEFD